MNRKMFAVAILLVASAVFAGEIPQSVKHFADWIPQLEFDSTNDCYVAQYDPAARQPAYVYRGGASSDPQKVHPGGTCFFARGEKVHFTQHAGVGCTLTYTNKMSELNGVRLPAEFRFASRQLLISGRVASKKTRDVFEKYAFVVNAAGEAYDVTTRTKFHFGIPFHAPENTSPPRIDRSVENIQRKYRDEGVEAYKTVLGEPIVQAMKDSVKEGVTNAVSFVRDMGGMGNLREKDKKYLIQLDPENARLFAKLEASRWRETYVVFCTREKESMRILAVARTSGNDWHFWTCFRDGVPEIVFLGDGQGTSDNYYEYGNDGLFRNFCIVSKPQTVFHTIKDGVLQKSSDMLKAQAFIVKVEEMFNRYVELDTTGKLKPFVEMLKAQANDTHLRQERVRVGAY